MREEGAAGQAATASKRVKFSRTRSGFPLLIPNGWTGTWEQAIREAAMGKKKGDRESPNSDHPV